MSRVEFNPDHEKATAFFRRILSFSPEVGDVRLVVIAHLVDSAIPYIPALHERYQVQAVLGKPSSIQSTARNYLRAKLPRAEFELHKDVFRQQPEAVFKEAFPRVTGSGIPVVLLDIGGYFAPEALEGQSPALLRIRDTLSERGYSLAGVVEDTENGHKRYEAALSRMPRDFGFSVFSVARSPLKKPENHLVGVAVTFSIEALLRRSNIVLQSRKAGVIGFGPIGRSVAHSLRNRGISVGVCEVDSVQLAIAAAQGFPVYHYDHHFDEFARNANLVVSATGAGANGRAGRKPLDGAHVKLLQSGTFIASVTSADDEIDADSIRQVGYRPTQLGYNEDVAKWTHSTSDSGAEHMFYMMLGGNAVNFRHEGVVGPAIQLLQGEVIACLNKILTGEGRSEPAVQQLTRDERVRVADAWLDQYLSGSASS